jgi:hypothetical protein
MRSKIKTNKWDQIKRNLLILKIVQKHFEQNFVYGEITTTHTVIDRDLALLLAREIEHNRVSIIRLRKCSLRGNEIKILFEAIRKNPTLTEITFVIANLENLFKQ